jgi:hypothetical protein
MCEARDAVRGALGAAMSSALAAATERAAFNHALRRAAAAGVARSWGNPVFAEGYRGVCLGLLRNARALADEFGAGRLTPEAAVFARPHELRPELWAELLAHKAARDMAYGAKPKANTNIHQCRRCKSRECSFYELQTRSGDEPTTLFLTCLECGNRWRVCD